MDCFQFFMNTSPSVPLQSPAEENSTGSCEAMRPVAMAIRRCDPPKKKTARFAYENDGLKVQHVFFFHIWLQSQGIWMMNDD